MSKILVKLSHILIEITRLIGISEITVNIYIFLVEISWILEEKLENFGLSLKDFLKKFGLSLKYFGQNLIDMGQNYYDSNENVKDIRAKSLRIISKISAKNLKYFG